DEVHRVTLRTERPQRPPREQPADVVGEHWPGAYGIDAGFRQLAWLKGDRVAGCKYVGTSRGAQRCVDHEKTALVEGKSGLLQPGRGLRLRGPQDFVGVDRLLARKHEAAGLHADHGRAGEYADPALRENALEAGTKRWRVCGEE